MIAIFILADADPPLCHWVEGAGTVVALGNAVDDCPLNDRVICRPFYSDRECLGRARR